MKEILDKLFNKEEDIAQENSLNLSDDTNAQEETKNITTEIDEITLESEPIAEQVSEVENNADEHIDNVEAVSDELVCDKVDNKPINVTFEVFVAELKHILNSTQGLDFELVELKKQINDLIYRHETHN